MYMALHIADPEVSRLAADLARLENTTKTEALRRVLRQAIADREIAEKRKGLREFTYKLIEDARKRNLPPMTKQEMDKLWGMDEIIGGD
jgi:hypothetical protein